MVRGALQGAMEVTQADLRAQCAEQHDAFAWCVHRAGGSVNSAQCDAERLALERCATGIVQMVRRINEACDKQYTTFETCARRAKQRGECGAQEEAFWKCAEPFTKEVIRE